MKRNRIIRKLPMENFLCIAARSGDTDRVRNLLKLAEGGADVNKLGEDGDTPLGSAARWGHTSTVELLVKSGADIDEPSNDGTTPLFWAVRWGHDKTVRFLVDKGAEIDKCDKDGMTPISWLAIHGHINGDMLQFFMLQAKSRAAIDKPVQCETHLDIASNVSEIERPLIDSTNLSIDHLLPTLENTISVGETKNLRVNKTDVLGRGSMNTVVYSGLFEGTRPIAIKCIPKHIEDDNDIEDDKRTKEARILSDLDHPNIIRYFIFDKYKEILEDWKLIALDLCDKTLDEFIEPGKVTPSADRKIIIPDILSGLNYLHNEGIIHNDLKPQNILMKKVRVCRTNSLVYRAVISDFGISLKLADGRRSKTVHENKIGTEGWRSKETIESIEEKKRDPNKKVKGTKEADIFAFGLIVHYIMSMSNSNLTPEDYRHPFGKDSERNENIKAGERQCHLSLLVHDENDLTLRFDRLLADMLVHNCINDNSSLRPVTRELLKDDVRNNQGHPLFWKPEEYLEFMCNVSECLTSKSNSSKSRFVEVKKKIQEKWERYCKDGFKARIEEAAFFYESRKYGDTLPEYLRGIRNIDAHFLEILEESASTDPDSKFKDCFGNEGSYEDFHSYFNCRVIEAFPIVYLQLYEKKIERFKRYFPHETYFNEDKAEIIWKMFDLVFTSTK